jgi:hypothetical protein
MPRSNEGMRLIFSAVIGVMLGYLFGISFPTVNITKVNLSFASIVFLCHVLCLEKCFNPLAFRSFTSLPVLSHILKIETLESQHKHCWTMHGHLQIVTRRTILTQSLMKFQRYFVRLILPLSLYTRPLYILGLTLTIKFTKKMWVICDLNYIIWFTFERSFRWYAFSEV